MAEEAAVFCCDDGIEEVLGDVGQGNDGSSFDEELRDGFSGPGEDFGGLGHHFEVLAVGEQGRQFIFVGME